MDSKLPNSFQRIAHRFAMMRPVSAVLAISLHRIDKVVFKLTKGKRTLAELFLPMVQITTIGAKTGEPRTMPLAGLIDGDKIALIGSNFGQKNNPGWYYNLKANPECEVQFHGRTEKFIAREAAGEEHEKYWQLAVSYYKGYELYKIRAAHRHIPILILEPAK
jgi:deazaflavin-dependent oxidoreductase (nitroreductase family)